MHLSFDVLIDYFVNRFIIPFVSAFAGFIIRNVNVTIKRTGRFGKIKTAIASSFIVAIITGAILQYVKFDISIIICLSVLAGTCGAEILGVISKPGTIRLVFTVFFKKAGAGLVSDLLSSVNKLEDDENKDDEDVSSDEKGDENDDKYKNSS